MAPLLGVLVAAFALGVVLTATGDPHNNGRLGLDCDFEANCTWIAEPADRFLSINGAGLKDLLKKHRWFAKDVGAPFLDHAGSSEGKFLLAIFQPEDGKRADPNLTLSLKSPLLNYTGTWCTLSMSVHCSWDESPIRVVVQDSEQKTVIDFGLHNKLGQTSVNKWSTMSTQISHHRQPFRILLEVSMPPQNKMKQVNHVAVDNIRFEHCSDDAPQKKCVPPRDFVCENGRCISSDHVCDLVKDCPNGEDEREGCDGMPENTRCDFETGLCGWRNQTNAMGVWALKQTGHYLAARKMPLYDHTFQNESGHCLIYDEPSDGKFGAKSIVWSDTFRPVPYYHALNTSSYFESCKVRFYYFLAGQNVGALSLHVTSEGQNKSLEVWSHQQETKDRWLRATFPLPVTLRKKYHLEFLAQRGLRHNSILAVDDISLSPECFGVGVPENETRTWPQSHMDSPETALEFRFSTCGANGRLGPNQESCAMSYAGTWTRVSLNQGNFSGIQLWKTPHTGYYTIIAKGASGGLGSGNLVHPKSRGAVVTTVVYLVADQPLHILVGQEGLDGPDVNARRQLMMVLRKQGINETSSDGAGGGGGGGTFIFQSDGPRLKPLAIASGGGGAPSLITEDNIKNIHGKGIHLGDMAAVDDFFESLAGHGGGWSGHKRNANSAGSLLEGAQGGKPCGQVAAFAEQFSIPLSEGGFGGGGGGCFGGGGGGGYYGGDGGEDVSSNGEGGWSFASGTDVAIQEGANEGPGEVVILPAMSGKRCGCEYQCLPLSADMVSIRCLCPSHLFLGPDGFSCIADVTVGQAVDLSVIIPLAVIAVIMFGVFIALSFSICNQYQKRRHRIMGLTNRPLSSMALNRMGAQFGDGTGATLLGAPTALPGGAVMDSNMVTEYNPNYEFGGICSLQDLKTVPRDRLSLVKGLGQGAFGEVYQGYLRNDENAEMAVAVKTLPDLSSDQASMDFLMEALIMAQFSHPNIVKFIGVSFECSPKFIVLELLAGGDLKTFLRESRPTVERPSPVTMKDLLLCSRDVAEGCRYLEENHFIHRDIAARNCLLTTKGPGRVVKIADFGMARDIYRADYYRKGGKAMLPVKWMPPEAFLDGVFTSKTDVWSFGILLWEVMSLGYMPYPGRGNQEVMEIVSSGGRLESPPRCPAQVYRIMDQCWAPIPEQRPNFVTILERIGYCLQDPDVINTALPICTGVMALEMDTTIIRPPPSTDGSLPCLSLARGIGRAHSLSSSGAQSSHRSGGSGSSMTIGTRSMRQANRSEYMVPRNASSGALASRAEQERAVFGDGEMSRQQSVPYNMHETASTERLLAEAYQNRRTVGGGGAGPSSSSRGGLMTAVGNGGPEDKHKRQARSQRAHSKKDRGERRRNRSHSRGRLVEDNAIGGGGGGGGAGGGGASGGGVGASLLRESDSSQPLLGTASCEGFDIPGGEPGGSSSDSPADWKSSAKSTPKRKDYSEVVAKPILTHNTNNVNNNNNSSSKQPSNLSAVALDPANLPRSNVVSTGAVRFTTTSPPPPPPLLSGTNNTTTTPNNSTDCYVLTSTGRAKVPLKENEISV